uniref:Uncharacterized protein n=1 Tax=Acrobeloides nanus TaxID=290746 RepID=A0A914D395_9BILA
MNREENRMSRFDSQMRDGSQNHGQWPNDIQNRTDQEHADRSKFKTQNQGVVDFDAKNSHWHTQEKKKSGDDHFISSLIYLILWLYLLYIS